MNEREAMKLQQIVDLLTKFIAESQTGSYKNVDNPERLLSQIVQSREGVFMCDTLTSSDIATYLSLNYQNEFGMVSARSAGHLMNKIPIAAKIRASKPREAGSGTLNLWIFKDYQKFESMMQTVRYTFYESDIAKYLETLDSDQYKEYLETRERVKLHASPMKSNDSMIDFT